jgi:hypothetical protein
MRTILVASSKGGAGKTTLATNLAAHFALEGKNTALVDCDRQRSSSHWCQKRVELDSAVLPIECSRRNWLKLVPADTERVVIDVPAGWFREELDSFLDAADAVLVPVQPSVIDLEATVPFLDPGTCSVYLSGAEMALPAMTANNVGTISNRREGRRGMDHSSKYAFAGGIMGLKISRGRRRINCSRAVAAAVTSPAAVCRRGRRRASRRRADPAGRAGSACR